MGRNCRSSVVGPLQRVFPSILGICRMPQQIEVIWKAQMVLYFQLALRRVLRMMIARPPRSGSRDSKAGTAARTGTHEGPGRFCEIRVPRNVGWWDYLRDRDSCLGLPQSIRPSGNQRFGTCRAPNIVARLGKTQLSMRSGTAQSKQTVE